jgi:outer membrane murein-binding lipoprotein Lpp
MEEEKKKRDEFISKVQDITAQLGTMLHKATALQQQIQAARDEQSKIRAESKKYRLDYDHSAKLGSYYEAVESLPIMHPKNECRRELFSYKKRN